MLKGVFAIIDVELTLSRVPGHICKLVSNFIAFNSYVKPYLDKLVLRPCSER